MIGRIAILGGSSVYIPELLMSFISHNLNVQEVVLVGRPGEKLDVVTLFCQRLVRKSGFPTEIVGTDDVAAAVRDARYVINHVRVGGMEARTRDEKIPPLEGMVGDQCLGAGGISCALRTLPVVFEHARIIQEVSPEATIINLTHPAGIVVEALMRHTDLKVLGLCDLPHLYIKLLADYMRHDRSQLEVDYIGLSQMGWIQDVKVDGASVMSRLLERMETEPADGFDHELIQLFRMVPTRSVSLYFHQDEVLRKQKTGGRQRGEVLHEAEKQILKLYRDESLHEIPELTRARNPVWYEETLVPLIQALEKDEPYDTILCIGNEGAIRDLNDYSSVEIPVTVQQGAIKRRKVGNCPRFLRGLFCAVKESDRLVVEAVRHKSYELALQSLAIHPLVPSLGAARRFLDRVMKDENFELH